MILAHCGLFNSYLQPLLQSKIMKLGMPYALNEIGQRSNQEDSIFPAKGAANASTRLFMVCDGMGGHEHGEVASGVVCSTFAQWLANIDHDTFTLDMFEGVLSQVYNVLDMADPEPDSNRKMGTTLALLHLNNHEAVVAHLGDSRVYHLRPSHREPILYQSKDHTLVNELVSAKLMTPEEAINHPRKNIVTRALQPGLERRHKADVHTITDVRAGDYFFLCSDGIIEALTDDVLVDILRRDISDAEKVETIREICAAESNDNFSAYLVPVVEGLPLRRRSGFASSNVALACVALGALLVALWFYFGSGGVEFSSVEERRYYGPAVKTVDTMECQGVDSLRVIDEDINR